MNRNSRVNASRKENVLERNKGPRPAPGWTQRPAMEGGIIRLVLSTERFLGGTKTRFYVLGKLPCRGSGGGVEKRRRVLSFKADMWHRVARLTTPGAGDEDGASKQALPAPDQAVGEGRILFRGNTLVVAAWVKNMAVRSAGAGTGLALSTTSALEKASRMCLIYEQKAGLV